jgi:hypothetical protein
MVADSEGCKRTTRGDVDPVIVDLLRQPRLCHTYRLKDDTKHRKLIGVWSRLRCRQFEIDGRRPFRIRAGGHGQIREERLPNL